MSPRRSCFAFAFIAASAFALETRAEQSVWAYPGVTGRMIYAPDAQGDRVLDFSNVGYRGRGAAIIPDVPTVLTVSPVAGDDRANIQAAIDQLAGMPLNADGFRGAVQLTPGDFDISSQLNIFASGIVLRGAGRDAGGTVLHAHSTSSGSVLINVSGTGSQSLTGPTGNMIDKVVPAGATSFRVDSTAGFAVGDTVRVTRPDSDQWIADIGMNAIPPRGDGGEIHQWDDPGQDLSINFDRIVTRIEGNRVFLDAPLANSFELRYGGGTIRKYTWPGRIQNVGVENLRGDSDFASATDENHAWDFVSIDRAQNVWVRDTTSTHFAGSAVVSNPRAKWVTVDNAINLDPKSQITGERRYTFDLSGQLDFVGHSEANQGRHDFVNNSTRPPGPHVFYRSASHQAFDESGPHQRWATGSLFDNIVVEGEQLNARNRGNYGTGHGWAGANMVIWNSRAESFIVQNPPTAQNWLIGSTGTLIDDTTFGPQPPGYVNSLNAPVDVDSLYDAQFADAANVNTFHWNAASGNWSDPAAWRENLTPGVYSVQIRDYLIGDIDDYAYDGAASVDDAFVSPQWSAALGAVGDGPVTGLDRVGASATSAMTIQHQLDPGERVIHGWLALAMKRGAGSATDDYVRLFDAAANHKLDFSTLGWSAAVDPSQTFVGVLDMGHYLPNLQTGSVNVAVSNDTGLDWAMYTATVARPTGNTSGASVFVQNGGTATLSGAVGPLGSLTIGGAGSGQLNIASAGRLSLAGDYRQQATGTLAVELSATSVTPKIAVAGDAALAGALQISLAAGFEPAPGAPFVILTAAEVIGQFDSIQLPTAAPDMYWFLNAAATSVTAQLFWSADFNHDGSVNAADLDIWKSGFGTPAPALQSSGDADGDGDVDGADFTAWQRQLGRTSASLTTVPEPGALPLALLLGLLFRERLRNRSYRRASHSTCLSP